MRDDIQTIQKINHNNSTNVHKMLNCIQRCLTYNSFSMSKALWCCVPVQVHSSSRDDDVPKWMRNCIIIAVTISMILQYKIIYAIYCWNFFYLNFTCFYTVYCYYYFVAKTAISSRINDDWGPLKRWYNIIPLVVKYYRVKWRP